MLNVAGLQIEMGDKVEGVGVDERKRLERVRGWLRLSPEQKFRDAGRYCVSIGCNDRSRYFEHHTSEMNWEELDEYYWGKRGVEKVARKMFNDGKNQFVFYEDVPVGVE